jgi:hypothetical protein
MNAGCRQITQITQMKISRGNVAKSFGFNSKVVVLFLRPLRSSVDREAVCFCHLLRIATSVEFNALCPLNAECQE